MRSAAPYSWSISGMASRSNRAARSWADSSESPVCSAAALSSTVLSSTALASSWVSTASAVRSVPGTALLSRRIARPATSGTATPVATA
ncbi:hypothetical protein BJF90_16430 [Pseudonocardia sp. CNS-004]|nr:hypothetical protein BJF90_16430 [Pseudonocardia sp. CNS-004]